MTASSHFVDDITSPPRECPNAGQAVDILVDLLFVSDIAWEPRVAREEELTHPILIPRNTGLPDLWMGRFSKGPLGF